MPSSLWIFLILFKNTFPVRDVELPISFCKMHLKCHWWFVFGLFFLFVVLLTCSKRDFFCCVCFVLFRFWFFVCLFSVCFFFFSTTLQCMCQLYSRNNLVSGFHQCNTELGLQAKSKICKME